MYKIIIVVAGMGLAASFATARSAPRDAELSAAVELARELVSQEALDESLFGHVIPGGSPSEYADLLFSEMGRHEWDASSVRPVRLRPAKAPRGGSQVVIVGGSGNGEMLIQAFADPDDAPVWEERIAFPTVSPNPDNTLVARTLVASGASYRTR